MIVAALLIILTHTSTTISTLPILILGCIKRTCHLLSKLFYFSRELRDQIKPESVELIKQQRLNYLVEGTRFHKYQTGKRLKGQMMKM